jgi:hypothetical protein
MVKSENTKKLLNGEMKLFIIICNKSRDKFKN